MSERAQLRWRCRRGLLELDIVFARFLEEQYEVLDAAARADFARLLRESDASLMQWLGGVEPPAEFAAIVRRLR